MNIPFDLVSAVTTIILVLIAWGQLSKSNKIAAGNFIYRFTGDFFKPETQDLFILFAEDLIEYKEISNTPYFIIRLDKIDTALISDRLKEKAKKSKQYSSYEIDNDLLGYFEDLHLFLQEDLITRQHIDHQFRYYIDILGKNQNILSYLKFLQSNEKSTYDGFIKLNRMIGNKKALGRSSLPGNSWDTQLN